MGGFKVLQAFPNYLICWRFVRISTVCTIGVLVRTLFQYHRCAFGLPHNYLFSSLIGFAFFWDHVIPEYEGSLKRVYLNSE